MNIDGLTDKGISVLCKMKAMEEANLEREEQGMAHAYSDEAFFELAEELEAIQKEQPPAWDCVRVEDVKNAILTTWINTKPQLIFTLHY